MKRNRNIYREKSWREIRNTVGFRVASRIYRILYNRYGIKNDEVCFFEAITDRENPLILVASKGMPQILKIEIGKDCVTIESNQHYIDFHILESGVNREEYLYENISRFLTEALQQTFGEDYSNIYIS